jgi:Tfp pilus assembly protein PilE
MNSKLNGFTLIELVIFIVVISVTFTTLAISFQTLLKKSYFPNRVTTAVGLAQARMELILGQRYQKGFTSFVDPCTNATPPAVCTLPAGYTIATPTIANTTIGSDTNFKTITVTVSGLGRATLKMLVGSS